MTKAYLVSVRIPGLGPSEKGALNLFVAVFDAEDEALQAVKHQIPSEWSVEGIVGFADERIVARHKLRLGDVHQL